MKNEIETIEYIARLLVHSDDPHSLKLERFPALDDEDNCILFESDQGSIGASVRVIKSFAETLEKT